MIQKISNSKNLMKSLWIKSSYIDNELKRRTAWLNILLFLLLCDCISTHLHTFRTIWMIIHLYDLSGRQTRENRYTLYFELRPLFFCFFLQMSSINIFLFCSVKIRGQKATASTNVDLTFAIDLVIEWMVR